jgi:hypothetical protein
MNRRLSLLESFPVTGISPSPNGGKKKWRKESNQIKAKETLTDRKREKNKGEMKLNNGD